MGQVGVHLHDIVGSGFKRVGEPRDVCRAETLLAVSLEQVDSTVVLSGQPQGDFTRAVGGTVVHDDEGQVRDIEGDQSLCQQRQILGLVVGGHHDGYLRAAHFRHSCTLWALTCDRLR